MAIAKPMIMPIAHENSKGILSAKKMPKIKPPNAANVKRDLPIIFSL